MNMTYSAYAKNVLSKTGYKLTTPRLLVLQFLEMSDIPQNAYDVKRALSSKKESPDIVSIYRNLALLKKLNLVHEVSDGKFIPCQKFTCTKSSHCHHQFVCTACRKTEEIHLDDKSFMSKVAKLFPKLSIKSHSFHFEGLCAKCSNI
jgi:Fe2+ or Zn2+ uptake regulation protein